MFLKRITKYSNLEINDFPNNKKNDNMDNKLFQYKTVILIQGEIIEITKKRMELTELIL